MNELNEPIEKGTKLTDLVSGRSYYEVTNIYIDESLTTNVRLQEYWNNTESMKERRKITVTIEDISGRLENNEIAFI